MAGDPSDLPTLQEELDRKAIETLEWLLVRMINGNMSRAAAEAALDALWGIASGLVRQDFTELFSATADEFKEHDASYKVKRVFINERNGSVAVIQHEINTSLVELLYKGKEALHFNHHEWHHDDGLDAQTRIDKLLQKMNSQGFKEVE